MNTTPQSGETNAARFSLITKELAARLRVEPQTVRKQYSKTGSYCGLRPMQLPNRRLLWPEDALEQLVEMRMGERE